MKNWTFKYTPILGEKNFDWQGITKDFSWIQDLQGCEQDPIHHAEGDVHIHTKMVLDRLVDLPYFNQLNETERSVLFLSALMHDIGKPYCSKKENGRITAHGHARKGANMARPILYRGISKPVPFHLREKIVQLVRHHGLPLWFWDKPDPQKTLLKVSQSLNLQDLSYLSEADATGRTCADLEDLLVRINFFREYAQEQNAYTQPYPFENGLNRFTYFNKHNNAPTYVPYNESTFEVILLCGLPGVGKNTWIENNGKDLPIVSLDDIRRELKVKHTDNQGIIFQASKEKAKTYLRKKQPFIWNATNLLRQHRQALISLFTTYKATVKLVYLEVDYLTLLKRNKTRQHSIPFKKLEQYINKLEVPESWEAYEVKYEV